MSKRQTERRQSRRSTAPASTRYAHLSVYDPESGTVRGKPAEPSTPAAPVPERPHNGFYLAVPRGSDRYYAHLGAGCPYCVAPQWVETAGWPMPCRVLTGKDELCDAQERSQHRWSCTWWDHTDELPF